MAHESNAYGLAPRQHHDLLDSLNEANTINAGLGQKLQEYAHHRAMMQQSAVGQIAASEKRSLTMRYELDRTKYEIEDMQQQRSVRSAIGSTRSDSMAAASVHEYRQCHTDGIQAAGKLAALVGTLENK